MAGQQCNLITAAKVQCASLSTVSKLVFVVFSYFTQKYILAVMRKIIDHWQTHNVSLDTLFYICTRRSRNSTVDGKLVCDIP